MTNANKVFLKIGRIFLYCALTFFVVLPLILTFVTWLSCKNDASEFCGLGLAPILIVYDIVANFRDYIYLPMGILLVLFFIPAVFLFGMKFVLRRFTTFDIGYIWPTLILIPVVITVTAITNAYYFPHSSLEWPSWAEEAMQQDDPGICLEKIQFQEDSDLQVQCLKMAAQKTGEMKFCEKISEIKNNYGGEWAVESCKTDLVIVGNYAKKNCEKDYDYACFDAAPFECYGFLGICMEQEATAQIDPSYCDLYKGSPNDQAAIDLCYASVIEISAAKKKDPLVCEEISGGYDWSETVKKRCIDGVSSL